MASIFGVLDKRQRAEKDALAFADAEFGFEARADLFDDLLEEDTSTFPLLACPPEVLTTVLLLSDVQVSLRIRPLCCQMRGAIDNNTGLWCSLILRDFEDMGGMTKHYQGLRTLADAAADVAFTRLEWDPLMICAPPPLRYTLLAAAKARRRRWEDLGHTLAAAWSWFSSRVCRRMAVPTFLRWASLNHEEAALRGLMGQHHAVDATAGASAVGASGGGAAAACGSESAGGASGSCGGAGMQFRPGRSDALALNAAAVCDIFETVQKWHNKAHRDMMSAHFGGVAGGKEGAGAAAAAAAVGGQDVPSGCSFSVTPTLDAAEAAFFSADAEVAAAMSASEAAAEGGERGGGDGGGGGAGGVGRGEASRRLEEAQLRLALEMSRKEAAPPEAAAADASPLAAGRAALCAVRCGAAPAHPPAAEARSEPTGLVLRAEGIGGPAPVVFLKPHCLFERVGDLPEGHERSIENVAHKLTTPSTWGLLYESITEELGFRAKSAAHALMSAHARAVDGLLREDISLTQERVCLPIWRSSRALVTSLSRLRPSEISQTERAARRALLRQASLEWCELEDLTEFLDSHLGSLELAIDNFRGEQEICTNAHTPHIRDIGRLMFRNFCLLDSRMFKPLCLAAYGLVHEVCAAGSAELRGEDRGDLCDLLEGVHSMLMACDVADDDLSMGKNTKDAFVEHLVQPLSAAVESLSDWDVDIGRGPCRRDVKLGRPRRARR